MFSSPPSLHQPRISSPATKEYYIPPRNVLEYILLLLILFLFPDYIICTSSHPWQPSAMETFHSIFKASSRSHFIISFSLLSTALLPSLYPFLLKLLIYFAPLLFSTAAGLLPLYLFLLWKEKSYRETLFVGGGKGRVVQVCEEANFSSYEDHVGAGFLFLRTGGELNCGLEEEDDEEEDVIFGGTIDVGRNICEFVEKIEVYEVDCLAEGLWNAYFGRFSRWNHFESILKEESDACGE